jgi:hypothetical protein
MTTHETTAEPEVLLRALDPNLPLLAATAAVEIDNLLVAQAFGATAKLPPLEALPKIAQMLKDYDPEAIAGAGPRKLCDPVSNSILDQAYKATFSPARHPSIESFREATNRLARAASPTDKPGSSDQFLAEFRDFLIALSSYSAAKRQSALRERSKPSYRR